MTKFENKIDFAVLISVNNANPNGDPLNGNRPRTDYNGYGKLQYLAAQNDYAVLDTEFTQDVKIRLLISHDQADAAVKIITEATNGRADIEKTGEQYFARAEGRILTF